MIKIIFLVICFGLFVLLCFLPSIARDRALKKLRDRNNWDGDD